MALVPPEYTIIGTIKIEKAKQGFDKIINEFSGENVVAQITAAKKTKIVADAMRDVLFYGSTGSLWEVYICIERIKITPEMAPYLTESRKQEFKNRIIELIGTL